MSQGGKTEQDDRVCSLVQRRQTNPRQQIDNAGDSGSLLAESLLLEIFSLSEKFERSGACVSALEVVHEYAVTAATARGALANPVIPTLRSLTRLQKMFGIVYYYNMYQKVDCRSNPRKRRKVLHRVCKDPGLDPGLDPGVDVHEPGYIYCETLTQLNISGQEIFSRDISIISGPGKVAGWRTPPFTGGRKIRSRSAQLPADSAVLFRKSEHDKISRRVPIAQEDTTNKRTTVLDATGCRWMKYSGRASSSSVSVAHVPMCVYRGTGSQPEHKLYDGNK
ncbi:hypothetical protein F2P81_014115 [Scophthalmus maximus]|uniref:Uncharacterized protein n=1 Tax=Scophthalmus maximus TaxID=52904 RepID=A0A6A4SN15_SCOMX|nr:hypothetical protein F2P81_014115 [Scophthalmus maximus]